MTAAPSTPELASNRPTRLALSPAIGSASSVVLWMGDCKEVLPLLDNISAVVTDPPYGMGYKSGPNSRNSISSTGKRYSETILGDDKPFDPTPWVKWPCVMTGAHWYYDRLPAGGTIHTWDKRGSYEAIDQADCDQIWCSLRRPPRKLECVWRGLCRTTENTDPIIHPTQKPVMVMAWMMERLEVAVGATVLDPYMGSGSTGIACIRTGRNFVGIEKDARHYKTAVERLRHELNQGVML